MQPSAGQHRRLPSGSRQVCRCPGPTGAAAALLALALLAAVPCTLAAGLYKYFDWVKYSAITLGAEWELKQDSVESKGAGPAGPVLVLALSPILTLSWLAPSLRSLLMVQSPKHAASATGPRPTRSRYHHRACVSHRPVSWPVRTPPAAPHCLTSGGHGLGMVAPRCSRAGPFLGFGKEARVPW